MENKSKKNHDPQNNDSQNNDKKYPGHTSEEEETNATNKYSDSNLTDSEKEERLAESGPVRNPNYHTMDTVNNTSSNRYRKDNHNHPGGTDGKTLEDFNDTEPKRDINKAANNETKDHIKK